MCILCHVSDFFRYIGYPMVMGFVHIFVSGVKFITAEELSPYVESSEHENQLNTDGTTKRKFFLLDARRTDEFVISHIFNATNIHSTFTRGKDSVDDLKQKLEAVAEKDTLIVTYCAVGLRSSWLAKYLTGMGYTNCKVLYHGFYEWTNSGRPIYGELQAQVEDANATPNASTDANATTTNPTTVSPKPARTSCPLEGLGAPTAPSSSSPEKKRWSWFGLRKLATPPPAPTTASSSSSSSSSSSAAPKNPITFTPDANIPSSYQYQVNNQTAQQMLYQQPQLAQEMPGPNHTMTEHMTTVPPHGSNVTASEAEAARHVPIQDTVVEGKNNTVQTVHMCTKNGCRQTNKVLPQHFIASLALEQKRSTKDKFPLWLGPHRKITN